MKHILIIVALLTCSTILAQDPQLFEDTWYLQKLTIDGEESFPPNLEPVIEETTFVENDEIFVTGYCDNYIAEITFNNQNNSFDINTITELGGSCSFPESLAFDFKYHSYFEENQTIYNSFFYEITNSNGIRYLEFTNGNGDSALYANQLLATEEQNTISGAVYPNPAATQLNVRFNEFDNEATLHIVDINGKVVYESTVLSMNTEIEISTLKAGVYFLNVITGQGKKAVFKFIKD